jgi:hypothetical protein
MPKLIIDDTGEEFTHSECDCSFCTSTHLSVDEWKAFYPKTNLQKRMLNVVKSIERKNKNYLKK